MMFIDGSCGGRPYLLRCRCHCGRTSAASPPHKGRFANVPYTGMPNPGAPPRAVAEPIPPPQPSGSSGVWFESPRPPVASACGSQLARRGANHGCVGLRQPCIQSTQTSIGVGFETPSREGNLKSYASAISTQRLITHSGGLLLPAFLLWAGLTFNSAGERPHRVAPSRAHHGRTQRRAVLP